MKFALLGSWEERPEADHGHRTRPGRVLHSVSQESLVQPATDSPVQVGCAVPAQESLCFAFQASHLDKARLPHAPACSSPDLLSFVNGFSDTRLLLASCLSDVKLESLEVDLLPWDSTMHSPLCRQLTPDRNPDITLLF